MLDSFRVHPVLATAKRSFATHLVSALLVVAGCTGDGGRTVTFSAGPTSLVFAAAQDGDGEWNVVTPSDDGTYEISVTAPTYGIALVCGDGSIRGVTIVQAAVAETTSPSFECSSLASGGGSISGSLAGTSAGHGVSVHVGYARFFTTDASYSGSNLPAGEWDVFALRQSEPFRTIDTDRVVRKNAVMIPQGGSVVVDFDFATEGFDIESHTVSIEGEQVDDRTYIATSLRNVPRGELLELGSLTADRILTLPRSALRDDDIHAVNIYAPGPERSTRRVRRWFVAAKDFTAVLPTVPPPPVIESASSGSPLLMRGTIPDGLDVDEYMFSYTQHAETTLVMWTVTLTRGYVDAGHPSYTLPDLTGLAGFDATLGFVPGTSVDWGFSTTSSDRDVGELLTAYPSAAKLDGREDVITTRWGRIPE